MSTTNDRDEIETLPAPVLPVPLRGSAKWQREYDAFRAMLPELMQTQKDKYVAVHEGKVVGIGDDLVSVALHAYKEHGYVPIYVGPVTYERIVERHPVVRPANETRP